MVIQMNVAIINKTVSKFGRIASFDEMNESGLFRTPLISGYKRNANLAEPLGCGRYGR